MTSRLQICACYLEKPPSSAIGVVNEVCSWNLVGSLTKPHNRAILFPSLEERTAKCDGCEVADFSSCQQWTCRSNQSLPCKLLIVVPSCAWNTHLKYEITSQLNLRSWLLCYFNFRAILSAFVATRIVP